MCGSVHNFWFFKTVKLEVEIVVVDKCKHLLYVFVQFFLLTFFGAPFDTIYNKLHYVCVFIIIIFIRCRHLIAKCVSMCKCKAAVNV